MKRQYKVNVTEKNYGSVTVEAESEEEAQARAEDMYANGDVIWGKTDFQVGEAEEA